MKVRFPLLAKMLVWLLVHLAVLAGGFALFVAWQLRLGLDSLLTGSAGDRLKAVGQEISDELRSSSRSEWPEILKRHEEKLGMKVALRLETGAWVGASPTLPPNVVLRLEEFRRGRPAGGPGPERRPPPPGRGGPREGFGGPPDGPPDGPPEDREGPLGPPQGGGDLPGDLPPLGPGPGPGGRPEMPLVRPLFLAHGDRDGGYWAGIDLPLFIPRQTQPLHGILLLRSDDASGGGLFLDLKPWLYGGLAVLVLSLLLWAPFFIGISRYVTRLSRATDAIAGGKFDVAIGPRRSDELGNLGRAIESMAARLDRLVTGQKRFLGDVAHELCSPLARIRTGIGVLEHHLPGENRERLASIEEDVEELSRLVSEVLAFTKASTAPQAVRPEKIELVPLIAQAFARECPGHLLQQRIPDGLAVVADRSLLARAVANVLRNAHRHAGESCALSITAELVRDHLVELRIADDGPGVAAADLARLFEPFYRPDAARTREAGGTGLGLAIVRSAVEASGGAVRAEGAAPHGLAVVITLPAVVS